VDGKSLRSVCVKQFGIRIGPHTADYVLKHLAAPIPPRDVPVMGCDARTGIPVRRDVPLGALIQAMSEAGAASASSNAS